MRSEIELLIKTYQNHGIKKTIFIFIIKSINLIANLHILTCLKISEVKPALLSLDSKYNHGFLDNKEIEEFAKNKINQLKSDFIIQALEKSDECYAITEGKTLASYGWYSREDTLTDIENYKFCFDPNYVYMYKGLTHNDYRGQRLHAIGMSWALKKYLEKEISGILSYVEAVNFDSLKSCFRTGYEEIGKIYLFSFLGLKYQYISPGCYKYSIRLK